jgi:hypothetical protein
MIFMTSIPFRTVRASIDGRQQLVPGAQIASNCSTGRLLASIIICITLIGADVRAAAGSGVFAVMTLAAATATTAATKAPAASMTVLRMNVLLLRSVLCSSRIEFSPEHSEAADGGLSWRECV